MEWSSQLIVNVMIVGRILNSVITGKILAT